MLWDGLLALQMPDLVKLFTYDAQREFNKMLTHETCKINSHCQEVTLKGHEKWVLVWTALRFLTLWSSWQPFSLSTKAVNTVFTSGVHYLHPAVLHFLVSSKVNVCMQQMITSANISWSRDIFQIRGVAPACHMSSSCLWHKRCRNHNSHIYISNPSHLIGDEAGWHGNNVPEGACPEWWRKFDLVLSFLLQQAFLLPSLSATFLFSHLYFDSSLRKAPSIGCF